MSEYRRERRPCFMPEELHQMRPQLEDLVYAELSHAEKVISCVIEDIERSESLDSLALRFQRFSSTYSFILNEVVRKIFRRWPRLRFLGRDSITLFVSEMSEGFLVPLLEKALGFAQSLGRKFGAESISITFGAPFTISITIEIKIRP